MCHVARLHLRQDVADNAPSTHRKCRPLPCRARAIPAGLACDADGQKCAWSLSLRRKRCRGPRTADPVESAVEAGAGTPWRIAPPTLLTLVRLHPPSPHFLAPLLRADFG